MRHIESSFRSPAFPACEPSPQMFAARPASSGGSPAARTHARRFPAPGAPVCPPGTASRGTHAHPRREGGVHGEAAPQPDPAGAPQGTTKRESYQRLGCGSLTTGATSQLCPWVKLDSRRNSKCGWRPCGIVWRQKKWPMLMGCWCPRREWFLLI